MRHPHTDMSRAGTGRRSVPCGLVTWGCAVMRQATAVQEASRARDYGKVIELVRQDRRMTQAQLGGAIGLSQSAVSRLEKRGARTYSTDIL
ncbi:helix-turn-helix transcriptional regulator, partial [Streptomyces beijiangensis]|nr:helix-turn-helix transcriptional regulator [Streptomyces beijiangensis]